MAGKTQKTQTGRNDSIEDYFIRLFEKNSFEKSRRFTGAAWSTENLRSFLQQRGNPQTRFRSIHIAGTAGKGSLAECLYRFLLADNYRAGKYISPHYDSLFERIQLNNAMVTPGEFSRIFEKFETIKEFRELSFFDAITAIAFEIFAAHSLDIAVVETGLGGRLDSTNVIPAVTALFVPIHYDHESILGSSLREIAAEKAGILKKGQRAYSFPQLSEVREVLDERAASFGISINYMEPTGENYKERNCSFATAVYEKEFSNKGDCSWCSLPGRLEWISKSPRILFDSAHNQISMIALAEALQSEKRICLHINCMRERSLAKLIDAFQSAYRGELQIYLFPMQDDLFYKQGEALLQPGDFREECLNVVTGSLRLRYMLNEKDLTN